jgi:hypothetical protein
MVSQSLQWNNLLGPGVDLSGDRVVVNHNYGIVQAVGNGRKQWLVIIAGYTEILISPVLTNHSSNHNIGEPSI